MRYLIITAVLFAGCEQNSDKPHETFAADESQYKLAVLVDMSPSFDAFMAEQGHAYAFLLDVIDSYFKDRSGASDRMIVAQISGKEPVLIWEGMPLELRQNFGPQTFAARLREQSDPNGSPVHESIAETLEYLMSDPNVAAGKTKPLIFVLSDMDDNFERTPELKERILKDLAAFGKLNGTFGIYYCKSRLVIPWQRALKEAGINNVHIESSLVANPVLPSFE